MRMRKAGFASGLVVSMVAVGFAAAAFACTSLATLDAPAAAAPVGSNVAVSGASFSARAGTPVIIHWGSASGPEVARTVPDASGRISTEFAVPKAEPGFHVLVATQLDAEGKAVYGTPARASFAVAGPDGATPTGPAVAPPPVSTPSSGSDGVLTLTLVLGAAGLALFGAGLITTVRHGRRRQPAPAPARLD